MWSFSLCHHPPVRPVAVASSSPAPRHSPAGVHLALREPVSSARLCGLCAQHQGCVLPVNASQVQRATVFQAEGHPQVKPSLPAVQNLDADR